MGVQTKYECRVGYNYTGSAAVIYQSIMNLLQFERNLSDVKERLERISGQDQTELIESLRQCGPNKNRIEELLWSRYQTGGPTHEEQEEMIEMMIGLVVNNLMYLM